MANKANSLKHQKFMTLKNSDDDFRSKAKKVEDISPIGYTSGMGNENYYLNGGVAYNSYTEAVNEVAKKIGI